MIQSVFGPTGTARRTRDAIGFAVLMMPSALIALIYTVPAPVLFKIGQEYGAWIAQGMDSLSSLGIILGGPAAGWLVSRRSVRGVLLPSLALYGIAGPMAWVIHDPYLLLASRFLLGFSTAGATAASIAAISARFDHTARLRMIGYQGGIGALLGLLTLKVSGTLAAALSWRAPFVVYAVGLVLLLMALGAFRGETEIAAPSSGSSARSTQIARRLWPLYLQVILLYAAGFSTGLQLSFKLGHQGIVDPRTQSDVILLASLMSGISSGVYGFIRPAMGARWTYALLIASMAIGALLIGVGRDPLVIGSGSAAMGLGCGLIGPHMLGDLVARVPAVERTAAVGLFYSSTFIGEFINPLFMQPLRSFLSSDGAFLVLGVSLAVATAWILLRSHRETAVGDP